MKALSIKEYAELEGITTSAVHRRIKAGRLESFKKHGLKFVIPKSYRPGKSGRPLKQKGCKDKLVIEKIYILPK